MKNEWFVINLPTGHGFILVLLLPCFLCFTSGHAQPAGSQQGFKRFWLANSGCAVSFPSAPDPVHQGLDVDSNAVYNTSARTVWNGLDYVYSVSVIQLREEADVDDLDNKLTSFMDYIKSTLNIVEADGYRKSNGLMHGKLAKGYNDKWRDHADNEFVVASWMKGRTMVLMYVMGAAPIDEKLKVNAFFNSFVFPSGY
jgi:hypothetical protein